MSLFNLLFSRRFGLLFAAQCLGVFNDNALKFALIIIATNHLKGVNPLVMVPLIMAIVTLPYLFFSAIAGKLADRVEKAILYRRLKVAEIVILALAGIGIFNGFNGGWDATVARQTIANGWAYWILGCLFLLATKSTFASPLAYSYLPEKVSADELLGANSLLQSGVYMAVLLGTLSGIILAAPVMGGVALAGLLTTFAVLGWLAASALMRTERKEQTSEVGSWWPLRAAWENICHSWQNRRVFRCILGNGWFIVFGTVWMSLIPVYVKQTFAPAEAQLVQTLIMALFSVGIMVGSILCNKILKGELTAKYVPIAGLGMSLLTLVFYFAAPHVHSIGTLGGVGILITLVGIAIMGGLYSVPLTSLVQHLSEESHRARNISVSNIINALFIAIGSLGVAALSSHGWNLFSLFALLASINFIIACYIIKLIPESILHTFFRRLLVRLYRVEVHGLENVKKLSERRIIIANHTSLLDAALIACFIPTRVVFAVNTQVADWWFVKLFTWMVRICPIDPTKPMAIKTLTDLVKKGETVVIFPEGRITTTGTLMKIHEGPGLIAFKADADILPVRIDGPQYSPLGYLKDHDRRKAFPKTTIHILPPQRPVVPEGVVGRAARHAMADAVYNIMSDMIFKSTETKTTLFDALLLASRINGGKKQIIEDVQFKPLNYRQFIQKALFLSTKLKQGTELGDTVGLLLPNSVAASLAFFGVQAAHRLPTMLNYSAGAGNILIACRTAKLKTVWTSRAFVTAGHLETVIEGMVAEKISVRYLEDLAKSSLGQKIADALTLWVADILPISFYNSYKTSYQRKIGKGKPLCETPAAVLFTSGSSGTPKAVILSHENLLANRAQLIARIDFTRDDRVFNCMPIFHSFGLTAGTILPILSGVYTFMYPSPLHYAVIPELIYIRDATLLFATNTFLKGYLKRASAYDFYSLRYIFAGAEKLQDSTRQALSEGFGVRVFEGYGATETAPVLSMNTPMHHKNGSVGRLLPGIEYKLEPIPGIEEGKKLWVKGPNVMLGYWMSEEPQVLKPLDDGWYDTGDIVALDEEGYIKILGRAKRFAKIGGEMVSLTAVEEMVHKVWTGKELHAVVSVPHEQKGEQLVLVTEKKDANESLSQLREYAQKNGIPEIAIPKRIEIVQSLPCLGSGKPDYVMIQKTLASTSTTTTS
jgi:acyl-[acyl-carrier-protein]-phospholipid O-acyltransferase/long-chain-fatty-acid--[acyl-carrier-protein] ligase